MRDLAGKHAVVTGGGSGIGRALALSLATAGMDVAIADINRGDAESVAEEVRALGEVGATAAKTLGLPEIRELLAGKISERDCIAKIQQATRRYAKRQLTWFRRQTNFSPLNLSLLSHNEARILLRKHLERQRVSGSPRG